MSIEGNDIRHLLDEVDLPGPRINLGEVAQEGQRVRRRRRVVEAVGSTALIGLVVAAIGVPLALHSSGSQKSSLAAGAHQTVSSTSTALSTGSCAVTALALPDGTKDHYQAHNIDPTGRYVVGFVASNTIWATMFWDNGTPQAMQVPGKPQVDAVNAHGVVVGSTNIGGDESVYRWENGNTTVLSYPMSGQWHPYNINININGDIVANVKPAHVAVLPEAESAAAFVTVLWKAGATKGEQLAAPGGFGAAGITDSGLIAGTLATQKRGAVLDLSGRQVGELPLGTYVSKVSPTGAIALAHTQAGNKKMVPSFAWDLQTGKTTKLSNTTIALGINAKGWVVDPVNGVLKDGNFYQLPPLSSTETSFLADTAIADDGTVIGQSVYDGGTAADSKNTPVEWHC